MNWTELNWTEFTLIHGPKIPAAMQYYSLQHWTLLPSPLSLLILIIWVFSIFFLLLLFSYSVAFDPLQPYELQHTRLPCPYLAPWVCSNSCPLSWWCHPIISSSVTPFSSCPQSFPASGSFPMNRLFTSGGQSIRASASSPVLPMNIQDWFHSGLMGLISLLSKGLSRVSSSTTVWKHQFFGAQPSLWFNLTFIYDNWKNYSFDYGPLSTKWYLCFSICCQGLS